MGKQTWRNLARDEPLSGVKNANQYTIVRKCTRVTGTVQDARNDADGWHVTIKVSAIFKRLLLNENGSLLTCHVPTATVSIGQKVEVIGALVSRSGGAREVFAFQITPFVPAVKQAQVSQVSAPTA